MIVITSWRGPFRDHLVFFPTPDEVAALADRCRPFEAYRIRHALDRPDDTRVSRLGEDWTRCIDLTVGRDALSAGMSKTSRYEIRRAERLASNLTLRRNDPTAIADLFRLICAFIEESGYTHPLRQHRYQQYLQVGDATVAYVDDVPVVGHLLLRDAAASRVRLTYSASVRFRGGPLNALVAPANRWLHWTELLLYASEGYRSYDFGGANRGSGIGRFKASLGGELTMGWNLELMGRIVSPAVRVVEARQRTQQRLSRS